MFYKHPLLKPTASHPMSSEICYTHVRTSESFALRENLNQGVFSFHFLYLYPKIIVWYKT